MVIRDVDSCILQASTYDTFLEMLKEKGYKIKQGKYMAVLMPGMKKYIRLDKIGDEYTRENIIKRIINESIIKAIKLIPSLKLYIADLKDIEEQNLQEFRKNILQNCIEPVN